MRASEYGHVETVRLLLDRGADVHAEDDVSTCECTDVSVSCLCVCLCVCLSVCVLCCSYVSYYCQFQCVLFVVLSLPLY